MHAVALAVTKVAGVGPGQAPARIGDPASILAIMQKPAQGQVVGVLGLEVIDVRGRRQRGRLTEIGQRLAPSVNLCLGELLFTAGPRARIVGWEHWKPRLGRRRGLVFVLGGGLWAAPEREREQRAIGQGSQPKLGDAMSLA